METALIPVVLALIGIIATGVGALIRAVTRGDLIPGSVYRDLRDQNRDLRRALGITGEAVKVAAKSRAQDR
jgi:hypothetical protein